MQIYSDLISFCLKKAIDTYGPVHTMTLAFLMAKSGPLELHDMDPVLVSQFNATIAAVPKYYFSLVLNLILLCVIISR